MTILATKVHMVKPRLDWLSIVNHGKNKHTQPVSKADLTQCMSGHVSELQILYISIPQNRKAWLPRGPPRLFGVL